MTIRKFQQSVTRNKIGIVGTIPAEADATFKRRGFDCVQIEQSTLMAPGTLDTMGAIIVTQVPDDQSNQIYQDLNNYKFVLDYDCHLYVRRDVKASNLLIRAIEKLELPVSGFALKEIEHFNKEWFEGANAQVYAPAVHVFADADDWEGLANLVTLNPAGVSPDLDLQIEGHDAENLDESVKLLLRRAFAKCSKIVLTIKGNGLSGVAAYEVFAFPRTKVVGNWPYRFFVKSGKRIAVAREFTKYNNEAMESVPFHLGPRLRIDRCVLGKSFGVIVSDYVSGAEPLRDCVRDGRGTPAIANLFNHTLLPWRRAATVEDLELGPYLKGRIKKEIPAHRKENIASLGCTESLSVYEEKFNECPSKRVLMGVIHGDLHATNVLVRLNDAVIIDMEKIEESGPILFDAASLEGGLLVDGFIDDVRPAADILKSIDRLYERSALMHDDEFCDPHERSAWFFDSVRHIRMQARQIEEDDCQYAWVLAAVLLKKSCNPENFNTPPSEKGAKRESIRALAYAVAERILTNITKTESISLEGQ